MHSLIKRGLILAQLQNSVKCAENCSDDQSRLKNQSWCPSTMERGYSSDSPPVKRRKTVVIKKSCQLCTDRRVKCSGPPGPCDGCAKRGAGAAGCVFLPRRKPGPKRRQYDSLIQVSTEPNEAAIVAESTHMNFSEYAFSLRIKNTMEGLRSQGFLTMDLSNTYPLIGEAYAHAYVTQAARSWITLFGDHRLSLCLDEFVVLMEAFQEQEGTHYGLTPDDLVRLYWLAGGTFGADIQFQTMCLVLMWLGPSQVGPVLPSRIISSIYDWIHDDPERIEQYDGFSSWASVETRVQKNSSTYLYLTEGKQVAENTYHIRNLARATTSILGVEHRTLVQVDMQGNVLIDTPEFI